MKFKFAALVAVVAMTSAFIGNVSNPGSSDAVEPTPVHSVSNLETSVSGGSLEVSTKGGSH